MNTFFNLTPHEITVLTASGPVKFEPSGTVARVSQETKVTGSLNGIPISETTFGETVGLPPPSDGSYYLVSRIVMAANPTRQDLLVPNDLVRDADGRVIGCQSLARN